MASDRAAARRALGDRGQGRSQWPGGDGWTKPLYRNLPAFGCGRKGGYKHYPLAPTTTGRIVREPGPMKHGGNAIAFLEDPNGYKIELTTRVE